MSAHPGHPAISGTDTMSASRAWLADALDFVSIQTVTATASINPDNGRIVILDATGGAITATLPDPAGDDRYGCVRLVLKKIDVSANAITVDVAGSGTIDGGSSVSLASQWDTAVVFNNSETGVWYLESQI